MQIHKNEIATGILVLVTFGVLLAILVVIGMPGLIKPLNTYRIYYDDAEGIRPGAPVLLAGRQIGEVTSLHSPVPLDRRPNGHADDEVSIDVEVSRDAQIYRTETVHLVEQSLMGQEVIDFVHGDETSGLAENHTEFVGDRVPEISEMVADNMKRLTGPGSDLALSLKNVKRMTGPDSDLALTLKNAKTFVGTLNQSQIPQVIQNAEQLTDTLKREPWRLLWPATKSYPGDGKTPAAKKKDPSLLSK